MPQITKHKKSARRVRKSPNAGANQARSRRTRSNGTAAQTPRIIGNSLFALTLKAKPEVEILHKTKGRKEFSHLNDDDNFFEIYNDLLPIAQHAIKLVTGETTKFDPLAESFDIGFSMQYPLSLFQNNVLPKGWSYNIDKGEEGYYFTAYKECEFKECWHAFDIKPVVMYLRRTNKKLHDLFIVFIRTFMFYTDVKLWWHDIFAFSEEWLEENISNMMDEAESDDDWKSVIDAQETLDSYQSGEAYRYRKLIENAKHSSPEKLIAILQKFNSRNKVVQLMKDMCGFMQLPGCMNDFHYHEFAEEETGGEGLQFTDQAAIIWSWDEYASMTGEWMDDIANNCGVIPPLLCLSITKKNRCIDFNAFQKRISWTFELSKLYSRYQKVTSTLEKTKK